MAKGSRFRILLRALPSDVPEIIRLRKFLKMALRSYRLRAERVEEITTNGDGNDGDGGAGDDDARGTGATEVPLRSAGEIVPR